MHHSYPLARGSFFSTGISETVPLIGSITMSTPTLSPTPNPIPKPDNLGLSSVSPKTFSRPYHVPQELKGAWAHARALITPKISVVTFFPNLNTLKVYARTRAKTVKIEARIYVCISEGWSVGHLISMSTSKNVEKCWQCQLYLNPSRQPPP
jgi:hypothetical protein